MTTKQIDITIYFKSDGAIDTDQYSYQYNPLSQQDIDETAAACANVVCELEQLACEHIVDMRITMDTPPEFQPHLMAAINQVKASSWNVIQHPRKLLKQTKPNKPTKSAGEKLSGENTPGNASCGLD